MAEETTPRVPAVISEALTDLNVALPRMIRGRDIAIGYLKDITKVTKESRQSVIDLMAKNRTATEKIKNEIRMPVTKRLDEMKQNLMTYEKDGEIEYERVKKIVSDFDNIELEIARKKEAAAERERQITTYKATIREAVGRELAGKVGGQVRNLIEGMAKWEKSLTLENIDAEAAKLQTRQLQLKREVYDACFQTEFIGKRTDLITNEDFVIFMDGLKKEYTYEKAAEEYLQQGAPIINEYRAKLPSIKEQLLAIKAGPPDMEAKRQEEIANKSWEALRANEASTSAKIEEVANEKSKQVIEAEFVKQGTLDGMDVPPVKRIPEFEDINNNRWIKPFLEVVAKCAVHPKFKLVKAKKAEYIDAVDWWMSFFGTNITDPIAGIKVKEEAKTVIRKTKEEF